MLASDNPPAKARISLSRESPQAEALGYLEAETLVDEFDEEDLFLLVDFVEFDFDDLAFGGGDGAAGVGGLDG